MRIPLTRSANDKTPIAWWEKCCAPIVVPIFLLVIGVMALISIPYFALYPENHVHEGDFGTPEERERLAEYRRQMAKFPFWKRLLRAAFGLFAIPFRMLYGLFFRW